MRILTRRLRVVVILIRGFRVLNTLGARLSLCRGGLSTSLESKYHDEDMRPQINKIVCIKNFV